MQRNNNMGNHLLEQKLIRKYLGDNLSSEEELLIAEKYEQDEDFREALEGWEGTTVEAFDEAINSIEKSINNKVVTPVMQPVREELHSNEKTKFISKSTYRKLAIAASILLCLALGSYVVLNSIQPTSSKMYAKHFTVKDYPDMIMRGAGDELSRLEKLAIASYNTENYEVSVEHFQSLNSKYPENEKYNLFLGIAYLANNQPEEAIKILSAGNFEDSAFCDDIDWYLGLAYLKVKNKPKAKEIFTKLSTEDCYYNIAAQEISSKL